MKRKSQSILDIRGRLKFRNGTLFIMQKIHLEPKTKVEDAIAHAIKVATKENTTVTFDFNDRKFIVEKWSNEYRLLRDYYNSFLDESYFPTIGPETVETYPDDVYSDLLKKKKLRELEGFPPMPIY